MFWLRMRSYTQISEYVDCVAQQTYTLCHSINPCHAEYFYVLHSSPIFILLTCSIPILVVHGPGVVMMHPPKDPLGVV